MIQTDLDIMGGEPGFTVTHVLLQDLIDYLDGSQPFAGFLEDFPRVTKEQAEAALRLASESLVAQALPA